MDQAISAAEESIPASLMQNRKNIYSIPTAWKIDGKPVLGRALGMKGVKLESKALFISCIEPHLDDLIEAVEEAGGSDRYGGFAHRRQLCHFIKKSKIAGCVLANIAETVSIVVFENNIPISLKFFPSADLTSPMTLLWD